MEQASRKSRTLGETEKRIQADALKLFRVSYSTDENGVTRVVFPGDVHVLITERQNESGEPEFVSPFVVQPQSDFLQCLEYTGRNLMTKAIKAEYLEKNPNQAGTRGVSAKLRGELVAYQAREAALLAEIEEMRAKLDKKSR